MSEAEPKTGNRKAGLNRLRGLFQANDFTALAPEAAALSETFPDCPFVARFHAIGLAGTDRPDAAAAELARARELGLGERLWLHARMILAQQARDWPAVVAATEDFGNAGGEVGAQALDIYCEALIETGEAEKSSMVADILSERFPNQRWGTRAKFRALVAMHDKDALADACEAWLRAPDATPERGRILRTLAVHVPELRDRSRDILQRLYTENPDSPIVERAIQGLEMVPDGRGGLVPEGQSLRLQINREPSLMGKLRLQLAQACRGPWPPLEPVLTQLEKDFGEIELRRPLIDDDPDAEVVFSTPGDSGEVAIVFTGMHGHFDVPNQLLDAYFAAAGIGAIFLRDPLKTIFMGGVDSLGHGFDATADALRARVAELGDPDRLTTYGNSAGGLACLRYGAELGARRIVGSAAISSATADFVARGGETRARLLAERLHERFDQTELCGKSALLASGGSPRIDFIFGAESPFDIAQAKELSGLDNLHLWGIPGYSEHRVTFKLFLDGLLADVVMGTLDETEGLIRV